LRQTPGLQGAGNATDEDFEQKGKRDLGEIETTTKGD
jgi:hypothetical protein